MSSPSINESYEEMMQEIEQEAIQAMEIQSSAELQHTEVVAQEGASNVNASTTVVRNPEVEKKAAEQLHTKSINRVTKLGGGSKV